MKKNKKSKFELPSDDIFNQGEVILKNPLEMLHNL